MHSSELHVHRLTDTSQVVTDAQWCSIDCGVLVHLNMQLLATQCAYTSLRNRAVLSTYSLTVLAQPPMQLKSLVCG
jgi:hypothetical protein